MNISENNLLAVICPICGEAESHEMYPPRFSESPINGYSFSARRQRTIQHYRIVQCDSCGLVRSDPILSREDAEKLYEESDFLYENESFFAGQTYLGLFNNLLRMDRRNNMKILDIGCGNGFFLERLIDSGFTDVRGIEPSRHAIQNANPEVRKLIYNGFFSKDSYVDDCYELITTFHLLDHIYDPVEFLNNCKNALHHQGILVMACHNIDAISAFVLGEQSPIFDIQHTFLYGKMTLGKLLKKCGFEILAIKPMWNRYPLRYWMKSVPIAERLTKFMPKLIGEIPITLPAGNLYAYAKVNKS